MAAAPVPVVNTPVPAQADITAAFAALAHKHATVIFWLIGVLVLVLGLAGVGGYIALRFADAQLARAEKMEAQYDTDRKAWQAQTATDAAARAAATAQQQVVVKVVDTRDKSADTAIKQAEAPKPIADVESGLRSAYKGLAPFDAPLPLSGSYIEFSAAQAQAVTVQKLAGYRDAADLADTRSLLTLEQTKSNSFSTDLSGCKSTLAEADKSIAAYKKAAKVSRFRKFLGGAEKALIFAGGVYLGHKV